MGLGYTASGFVNTISVPLAVTAKRFPDKKGIAVRTTVIGFGLSPLITAPLARTLIAQNAPDGWKPALIVMGMVFTACGMGALLGALTVGRVRDLLGSYTAFFYVTAVLAIVGIMVAVFMLKRTAAVIATPELKGS